MWFDGHIEDQATTPISELRTENEMTERWYSLLIFPYKTFRAIP